MKDKTYPGSTANVTNHSFSASIFFTKKFPATFDIPYAVANDDASCSTPAILAKRVEIYTNFGISAFFNNDANALYTRSGPNVLISKCESTSESVISWTGPQWLQIPALAMRMSMCVMLYWVWRMDAAEEALDGSSRVRGTRRRLEPGALGSVVGRDWAAGEAMSRTVPMTVVLGWER